MPAGNPSFGTLATTTLRNARNRLADNLSEQNVVLAMLRKEGGVRKDRGGLTIDEPLLYGSNSTVKSYKGYEILDLTPQQGLTTAQFDWKQIAGSVTISGEEEFKNSSSKTQIVKLLESKLTQLDISFRQEVDRQIYADGTGNGGKDIGGLDLLVSEAANTVGGIDETDPLNTWWAPKRVDFSGASFQAASGTSILGLDAMRGLYNDVLVGGDRTNLILTSSEVHEAYEAYTEGDKYRTQDTRIADLGFDAVKFKGIPVVWDRFLDATAGEHIMYFLNTKSIKFVIGEGKDFMTTPFDKPENQDARVSNMLLYANMTVSNRCRQGRISNIAVP